MGGRHLFFRVVGILVIMTRAQCCICYTKKGNSEIENDKDLIEPFVFFLFFF